MSRKRIVLKQLSAIAEQLLAQNEDRIRKDERERTQQAYELAAIDPLRWSIDKLITFSDFVTMTWLAKHMAIMAWRDHQMACVRSSEKGVVAAVVTGLSAAEVGELAEVVEGYMAKRRKVA